MDDNKNVIKFFNGLLLNKWFYITIGFLFITISFFFFKWNHPIEFCDNKYTIDNELFGAYGDFVGGVLGSIFTLVSILLVIKTFKEQQKVSSQNEEELKVQRFNDLFFELLRLYQSEVSELCGQKKYSEYSTRRTEDEDFMQQEIKYNDKDFFDIERKYIQKKYRNRKSYEKNRKDAVSYYMLFYIENSTKIGAYFRTLYRIYDLIDNSDLQEASKKNYLKIMRAQLTDSELFFIRYNAMTYYGNNFIRYINKYHILKHLPAFELLEFKDWWSSLDNIERMGINIVYDNINRLIRMELLGKSKNKDRLKSYLNTQSKYTIQINILQEYDVNLIFQINRQETNKCMEYRALDKYDDKRIQQLLDCFIKEIFIYSNFEEYNNLDEIETYSSPIKIIDNITYINSGIKNKFQRKLLLNSDSIINW